MYRTNTLVHLMDWRAFAHYLSQRGAVPPVANADLSGHGELVR